MKEFLGKKNVPIAMAALVAVIALAGGGMWVTSAVYLHRDDGSFVRTIAPALPAASVGSRKESYARFLGTRATGRLYMQSDDANEKGYAQPVTPEVEKNLFDRLVREAIIDEFAQEKSVSVSDDEVREVFSAYVQSASSSIPNVAEFLSKTFNWNEEQYRAKVVRPEMLEQKIMSTFSSSTEDQQILWEAYVNSRLEKPDVKVYLKFST